MKTIHSQRDDLFWLGCEAVCDKCGSIVVFTQGDDVRTYVDTNPPDFLGEDVRKTIKAIADCPECGQKRGLGIIKLFKCDFDNENTSNNIRR